MKHPRWLKEVAEKKETLNKIENRAFAGLKPTLIVTKPTFEGVFLSL